MERALAVVMLLIWSVCLTCCASVHGVTIDGRFDDWVIVTSRTDPPGTTLHGNIPDVHDTDHDGRFDIPKPVDHPDVDILEYKLTHDTHNLYAYFRVAGQIGRTQTDSDGRPGRYYAIVTIDVDDNDSTGYWLHEGGYYPTSRGYDMNVEIEYFGGSFNTGHYINHGARSEDELQQAIQDQRDGFVRLRPGSYAHYTEWIWFDDPARGEHPLPDDGASITFVADRGPVYHGNITGALSADGHELEMMVPFSGFMKDGSGDPIVRLGMTIDVSFSIEASGELAPGASWASDTADPIVSYYLATPDR